MPASRSDIQRWLERLYASDQHTHMIIKCDGSFHGCCYPVYVDADQDVHDVERINDDRTMEVYSRNHTREEQLSVRRAFNYD